MRNNIEQNIIFSDYYKKYIEWKWIDVSFNHYIKNSIHYNKEIDQLYRPWVDVWLEAYDFLYSFNIINQNKFSIICIKEWLYLIKNGWFMIIHFEENKLINHQKFLSDLLQSWPNWEFILEVNDKLNNFYVIKKVKTLLIEWDSIEKWTFWIVTQWKRDDWLNQIIDSIELQKIQNYEIILCWKVNNDDIKNRKFIKYIEFTENDEKWWITRKKNLIIENAKYENICIIHDRIIFDKNWFEWMLKWWNNFEHLSPYYEWEWNYFYNFTSNVLYYSYIPYNFILAFVTWLDKKDFDDTVVCWWNIHIWKKSIFYKYKWDEKLFWINNTFEDWSISYLLNTHWYFVRLNPYSKNIALYYRFNLCPIRKFNKYKKWWYLHISLKQRVLRIIWPFLLQNTLFKKLLKIRNEKDSLLLTFKKFIDELRKKSS